MEIHRVSGETGAGIRVSDGNEASGPSHPPLLQGQRLLLCWTARCSQRSSQPPLENKTNLERNDPESL